MTVPHLPTDAFDYHLPPEQIARTPAEPRDDARLLVVHRDSDRVEHRRIRDLPEYLRADDLMIFNTSAVLAARLIGRRRDSGGRVQGLFLDEPTPGQWRVMLRSNGRLRPGVVVDLGETDGSIVAAIELKSRDGADWIVRLHSEASTADVLDALGRTPLPPYILKARGDSAITETQDRAWYQTVYADLDQRASVAAPTAGLHFTPELLQTLAINGVRRADVVLHVGAGTFKPVAASHLDEHEMHFERFLVPAATAQALHATREREGRRIAVGTTTVRTLESLPDVPDGIAADHAGETDLFIAPGYAFRHVDGLLTNFHLPRSTLLALVAAMVGLDRLLALYAEAVALDYRFYSYGDAMLILPS